MVTLQSSLLLCKRCMGSKENVANFEKGQIIKGLSFGDISELKSADDERVLRFIIIF